MNLVDANLILYAEDRLSKYHDRARSWWDEQLSGTRDVCLAWQVINAFLRIATNPRILTNPLSQEEAIKRVDRWLKQPCVRVVHETRGHWAILSRLTAEASATANLIPDANLAAIAVGHGCTLCSSDRDFARFPSLDWHNPLAEGPGRSP
jgi:toxin-antitoxin system PIN domain toxin